MVQIGFLGCYTFDTRKSDFKFLCMVDSQSIDVVLVFFRVACWACLLLKLWRNLRLSCHHTLQSAFRARMRLGKHMNLLGLYNTSSSLAFRGVPILWDMPETQVKLNAVLDVL